MKTKALLFSVVFLVCFGMLPAQFSNTYQTGFSQTHSGFLIEKFGNSLVNASYLVVSTSYVYSGSSLNTNGVRITAVDNAGNPVWDKKYTNLQGIHCLDLSLDPNNGTFLITGYIYLGGLNRMFVARITSAGNVSGVYYINTGTFTDYYMHGINITTFGGGSVAVTGVATSQPPNSGNVSSQSNQMFLTILDASLNHVSTTFFSHQNFSFNNFRDVPLHITDLPNARMLHITGAAETNMRRRQEGVLNIYFDYAGNYMFEQSFMDMATETAEIGQYSYYDNVYDLIFLLTYKATSHTMGMYAVDPYTGTVLAGSDYYDPSLQLDSIYGLVITKDDVNSPNELFISGYTSHTGIYPNSTMPVFTVSMYIPDLLSGSSGFPALFAYPIDNQNYRNFDFSKDMFSSSSPVLNIPTSLGYTGQMAVMDNTNLVTVSPRYSLSLGGYHPTVSQNFLYYWHACTSDIFPVQYDRCGWDYITPIQPPARTTQVRLGLPGLTTLFTNVYSCSMLFREPAGSVDETKSAETENSVAPVTHKVYPTVVNEASADLTLELTDVAEHKLTVSIYDAAGRRIFQQNANSFAGDNRIIIKAENLAKGLNILHVTGLEKPLVTKILRN